MGAPGKVELLTNGLGKMAAQLLIEQGHTVVLHARNDARGEEALKSVPGAESVVIGDLSSIRQTCGVAEKVNALGVCDAVIHNAGWGTVSQAVWRWKMDRHMSSR